MSAEAFSHVLFSCFHFNLFISLQNYEEKFWLNQLLKTWEKFIFHVLAYVFD